jgi:hypothetical protein
MTDSPSLRRAGVMRRGGPPRLGQPRPPCDQAPPQELFVGACEIPLNVVNLDGNDFRIVRVFFGAQTARLVQQGGAGHTAPSKYRDGIVSLVFVHTKYGEPIVVMVFRRAVQTVRCVSPPRAVARGETVINTITAVIKRVWIRIVT